MEKKYFVEYSGGESRKHPDKAVDYMLCLTDEGELYAEDSFTVDSSSYGYLKVAIEEQAKDLGVLPASLVFPEFNADIEDLAVGRGMYMHNLRIDWEFSNGVYVEEVGCDHLLHAFDVYKDGEYLGCVAPSTLEDMFECVERLNAGYDPITDGWEDGCGNACTFDGWGGLKC